MFSTRPIRIVYHEYKRGRGEKGGRGGDSIHLVQSNARFHEVRLVSIQLSFVTFELRLFFFFSFSFSFFFFFSFFRSISKLRINSLEPARANYSSLKSKAIGSERFFFLYEFYDRFRFSFCLKIIYISLIDLLGTIYRMAYFFFLNFRNQTRWLNRNIWFQFDQTRFYSNFTTDFVSRFCLKIICISLIDILGTIHRIIYYLKISEIECDWVEGEKIWFRFVRKGNKKIE